MHQVASLGTYLVRPRSIEFDAVATYVGKLSDKLNFIQKVGQRIHQERLRE
jgi:hypothetical protein